MKIYNYLKLFAKNLNLKFASLVLLACMNAFSLRADRIYVLPGIGYNQAGSDIIIAISSMGHTVITGSASATTLPTGFTSTCVDPDNGYDYLCLFGTNDYSLLQTQIKAFIDVGGKVYFEHEVSCCVISSTGAAAVASGITGLNITPNPASYIALGGQPAWEAVNVAGCGYMGGNAYKCMDGVPAGHTLNATANLNGSSPPYTDCENFGMFFTTTDFIGTAHNGAFVAIGDVNLFYYGGEPPNNGGVTPVSMDVINFFFPNDTSTCFLFPPGCMITTSVNSLVAGENAMYVYNNSPQQQLVIQMEGKDKTNISIINNLGQQVLIFDDVKSEQFIVNTSALSNGVYFVKMVNKERSFIKKIVIE